MSKKALEIKADFMDRPNSVPYLVLEIRLLKLFRGLLFQLIKIMKANAIGKRGKR